MSLTHNFAVFANNNIGQNIAAIFVSLTFDTNGDAFAISPQDAIAAINFNPQGVVSVEKNDVADSTSNWLSNVTGIEASDYRINVTSTGDTLSPSSSPLNTNLSLGVFRQWILEADDGGFESRTADVTITVTEIANTSNTATRTITLTAETES